MVTLSHCFSVLFFLSVFSAFHILLPNGTVLIQFDNKPTSKESKTVFPYYFPFDERNIPVVTIPSLGKVIGTFLSSSNGRKYSAFRGIPYAKPPIGELRFKDPEPAEPWGLLDATRFGSRCSSRELPSSTSEDCLTLNIFTHGANQLETKPVIDFIHPGAFFYGSSKIFNPNYFLDRDVVFVTINYRLGAFGFISTGDAEAPGNYGLLDQNLALRFVRDHIHHFGGDPKSVTLMGHSAGGASAEYHILSPHSKGLFKGAIAQSGSPFSSWAFSNDSSLENTKRLAMDLNCNRLTSKDMLDCLRKKSPSQILASDARARILSGVPGDFPIGSSWLPRIDIEREFPFLPAGPEKLIREKRFNSVPYINGIAAREGFYWTWPVFGMKMEYFKQNHVNFIPIMCGFEFRSDRENLARKIYQYYFSDNSNLKDETVLEQMVSDCNFNKGGEDSARLFSQHNTNNPTFHYLFAQNGAGHKTIIFYQFGILPLITVEDKMVSQMLLDFWISFASKGIPHSNLMSSRWNPVNGSSSDGVKGYLKIENGKAVMINDSMPFDRRLKFLNNIFTP